MRGRFYQKGDSQSARPVRLSALMMTQNRIRNLLSPAVWRAGLAALGLSLLCGPASAQVSQGAQAASVAGGFQGYLQYLAARARADGVREATISAVMAGLTENPRVIALDRAQPGAASASAIPAFSGYRRTHVDAARINGGRRQRQAAQGVLASIEQRYGVPGNILLAIWGHETNYGSYTGDFDLARSLATLAY